MNRTRKLAPGILAVWLLTTVACNFPMSGSQKIPYLDFAATLTAQPPAGSNPLPVSKVSTPPLPSTGNTSTAQPGDPAPASTQPAPVQPTSPPPGDDPTVFTYSTQPGDTLAALAGRFGVHPEQIISSQPLPDRELIPPGQVLSIPNTVGSPAYPAALIPDSEVIDSPTTLDFDVQSFIHSADGFLNSYYGGVGLERMSGVQIVQHVARQTSTNPRLLLAVLEYQSHWVYGQPADPDNTAYPIGFYADNYRGLYLELSLVAKMLNIGYYGWRTGSLTELDFPGGGKARLDPRLNAGTVALQYLFSRLYKPDNFENILYSPDGFPALYQKMFGDPWQRSSRLGSLFPTGLQAPSLELPFEPGQLWSFTSGPHPAWNTGTPDGALDFAPVTDEARCAVSFRWATASADGVIARSDHNVVEIDQDGDGNDQTGWVVLYMHVADRDRVALGTRVKAGDRIGHPSCEGGDATGKHVHMARKYNGEWITADGPFPFVLSGWLVHAGDQPFMGTLTQGRQVIHAKQDGSGGSSITR